ncbi:MAG: DUF1573 domain-containing protein [Flavobacteriales bacterium]|jgi:hypothetical protein|nr:DUF1573 domain-containing protein [Flavobacteriales bacterium]
MKILIFIGIILPSFVAFAQQGTIVFDRVLHDFELIEEERGVVITEFRFTNTSKEKFRVVETKSSCACATMGVSKEEIAKGDTISLMVAYDPTGLPGKFNKSIEVSLKSNKGREIKRYLSIKGVTVSLAAKSMLAQKDTIQKEKNVAYYYKQKEVDKKINTKSDDYHLFIQRATKVALMHKHVKVLITIYHPEADYAFEKILRASYEAIQKDLLDQGIPEQSIIFLDPIVELSSQDKYIQLSIISEDGYSTPDLNENVLAEFLVNVDGEERKLPINSAQQMALPIYFQYFRGGLRDIDTTNQAFQVFLDELINQIKGKEEWVELKVISSASKWVYASDKFDNDYIANLRGKNALKTLRKVLKEQGLEEDKMEANIDVKVIGPEMNKRNYVPFFYRQFQYLKIIPVYKVKAKENNGTNGYRYTYRQNAEALNPRTKQFYAFVDQLAYFITTEGAVQIRLEGAASSVGKSSLSTKEKLAYTRVEDLKDNLERELYKRGINPQRMMITEELHHVREPVQGESSIDSFKKTQYVKAIIVR